MARVKSQTKPKRAGAQSKKVVGAKAAQADESKVEIKKRRFKLPKRATKLEKRAATSERTKVLAAHRLFAQSLGVLRDNWKLFLAMLTMYALVSLVLVGGVTGGGLSAAKATLNQTHAGALSKDLSLFGTVVSSSGNSSNPAASVYQTVLLLVMSVVLIWALRQLSAGHKIRARDAFYRGTYPLIPFLLVLLVVGLDLVPLLIGAFLYGLLMNGIAVGVVQQAIAVLIFFGLAVVSLYLVCSALMALYIVTLPDMTPMQALRSARGLVRYRRWVVLRKVLFLPLALIVIGALIIIPLALYVAPLAPIAFFALTILALAVVHSYMYALYRQLL